METTYKGQDFKKVRSEPGKCVQKCRYFSRIHNLILNLVQDHQAGTSRALKDPGSVSSKEDEVSKALEVMESVV